MMIIITATLYKSTTLGHHVKIRYLEFNFDQKMRTTHWFSLAAMHVSLKKKKARSKATRQRKKRVAQNMQIGRLTFYVILMGLFKHTRLLVLSRKYLKKNRCKETALHIYSDILMKQNLQQPRLRRNTFVIRIARFLVLLNFWAPEAHRAWYTFWINTSWWLVVCDELAHVNPCQRIE